MMRALLIGTAFISVVLFPWSLTVVLALASSFFEPLMPLAIGIFSDTLYYVPQAYAVPVYTLYGAGLTSMLFFVRSRLRAGSIER